MPIPKESAYFPSQDFARFFAAQGALFLVDPLRLQALLGDDVVGSDLLRSLTRKAGPHPAYREGVIAPALGVDQTHFTVTVRSTKTLDEPMPLSHMLFSTGFVLGTETGDLLLCNTDRLQHWCPGELPRGNEDHPLASFERAVRVSPGWYGVTVVTGLREPDFRRREQAASSQHDHEEWVCAFLLDPKPAMPPYLADLTLPLAI